jgi:hypothetical protein
VQAFGDRGPGGGVLREAVQQDDRFAVGRAAVPDVEDETVARVAVHPGTVPAGRECRQSVAMVAVLTVHRADGDAAVRSAVGVG